MKKTTNKRRYTPIPGLAAHMARFNAKPERKRETAAILAAFADRIYSLSIPRRRY